MNMTLPPMARRVHPARGHHRLAAAAEGLGVHAEGHADPTILPRLRVRQAKHAQGLGRRDVVATHQGRG
jgi:hypothetical protein